MIPDTALRDALVRDVRELDGANIVSVLEEHGWTPHRFPTPPGRVAYVDPDGVAVSPFSLIIDPNDPWHGVELATLIGHFAHAHKIGLLEALSRFGLGVEARWA